MSESLLAICRHPDASAHIVNYKLRAYAIRKIAYVTTGNCRSVYLVTNSTDGYRTHICQSGQISPIGICKVSSRTLVALHDGPLEFESASHPSDLCKIWHGTQSVAFAGDASTYSGITRRLIPMQDISYIPTPARDKPLISGYLHNLCIRIHDQYRHILSTHIGGIVYSVGRTSASIRDPRVQRADLIDCSVSDISTTCFNLGTVGDALLVPTTDGMLAIDTRNLASYTVDSPPYDVRRFTYE